MTPQKQSGAFACYVISVFTTEILNLWVVTEKRGRERVSAKKPLETVFSSPQY